MRRYLCTALLLFASGLAEDLAAQSPGLWQFDTIRATVGFDRPLTFSPAATFDRWGVRHLSWVTRDPNSAGLQVYRSDDASGLVGAPFLMTDTGTIYDSIGVDTTSYHLRIDADGHRHLLFLANVPEGAGLEVGLYYGSDRSGPFLDALPVRLTPASARAGLAVDSSGMPHVVWLRRSETPGEIVVHYWNGTMAPGSDQVLGRYPGNGLEAPVGDPQLAFADDRLHLFVRNDSGTIFHASGSPSGFPLSFATLALPSYGLPDGTALPAEAGDFRIAVAIDGEGRWHLLAPYRREDRGLELRMLTNADGLAGMATIASLDSVLLGLDIRSSGSGRVVGSWTSFRGAFPLDIPKSGLVEVVQGAGSSWQTPDVTADLAVVLPNPEREWRILGRLGLDGARVALAFSRYAEREDTLSRGVAVATRRDPTLRIVDLLPDGAGPGMSVVVEIAAPYNALGSFGLDRFDPSAIVVETVDAGDADRIIVGPVVTSWDGRLASVLLFIAPDAPPGPVPLRIRIGNDTSNGLPFHIVRPQRLGANADGQLRGGGFLGSGGTFGTTTPGGTLVVDSLLLFDGAYRMATGDIDPTAEGIEGMRPAVILAHGAIRIDSTARLSISALEPGADPTGTAGPGGGGGGASLERGRGLGYTAGGPAADLVDPTIDPVDEIPGAGSLRTSLHGGGGTPIGTPGGIGGVAVAGGGGPGHPFGTSGRYGRQGTLRPLADDPGGYGPGTAGSRRDNGFASGGGGGGYRFGGDNGGPLVVNGGRVIGSRYLIPLAGGSGGGGSYSDRGRSVGGGGGGALALYAERSLLLLGEITADGADGVTGTQGIDRSGGGGGSGGGVLLGAKGGVILGPQGGVSVDGGEGGSQPGAQGSRGGDGGAGRVRIDGAIDRSDTGVRLDRFSAEYFGPSTAMSSSFSLDADTLRLTGAAEPGRLLRLYTKEGTGAWSYDRPIELTVDTSGVWEQVIDASAEPLYIALLEGVADPTGGYEARPRWVMSTAGGLVIGRPDASLTADSLDFDCLDFGDCVVDFIAITNDGSQSDLILTNPRIEGGGSAFIIGELSSLRIPPGTSATIPIRFCPQDTGAVIARLLFNTNVAGKEEMAVSLRGCGRAGRLVFTSPETIDLGSLCVGDCRDTVVSLQNVGDAPLEITDLLFDKGRVAVTMPDETLPIVLLPGRTTTLNVRLCLLSGTGPANLALETMTPFEAPVVRFDYENAGPLVRILDDPLTIVRDVGASDTCPVGEIRLLNLRSDRSVTLDEIGAMLPDFTILSPSLPAVIGPGDTARIRVRYCGTSPGSLHDTARLTLLDGDCRITPAAAVVGIVRRSTPELALDVTGKIDLGDVPIDRASAPRSIRIINSGNGIGRNVRITVVPIAPTTEGEFAVDLGNTPFDIPGSTSQKIEVTLRPAAEGLRSARLLFADDDGWFDTIEICGRGVRPGVIPDRFLVDFGEVRGNDPSLRTLRFFNLGTQIDRITGLMIDDSTNFAILRLEESDGTPATLPFTLRPDGTDTLVVALRMTPTAPADYTDTLRAETGASGSLVVPMQGSSTIERAVVTPNLLRFDCPIETEIVEEVMLRNDGTRPMQVDEIVIEGADADRFRLLDNVSSTPVLPGAEQRYRIAYLGSSMRADAVLRIETSAPERLRVRLEGARCEPEQSAITLAVLDRSGHVGDDLTIPIELRVDEPLPEAIDLDLTITVDPTTLLPGGETGPGSGGVFVSIAGSLLDATATEIVPGTILLRGEIPAGTSTGTLLEIPVRVLRGRNYRTSLDIELSEGATLPLRYRPTLMDGTFIALDCDSTGGVDLSGIYLLRPGRPNPAHDRLTIPFEIARTAPVLIRLYNAAGELQRVLVDEELPRGRHTLLFSVDRLAAGLYIYTVESGRFFDSGRFVVEE